MSKQSRFKQLMTFLQTTVLLTLVSILTVTATQPSDVMALYNLNNPITSRTRESKPLASETPVNVGPKQMSEITQIPADGTPEDNTSNQFERVKELPELRTANSKTYLNSNGSKTLEYSTVPVNYKDKDDNWQEIKTSILPDSFYSGRTFQEVRSFSDPFGPKAYNLRTADISAHMKPFSEGVEISLEDKKFQITPIGGNNVLPITKTVDGQQIILYENAWNGVNVEYAPVGGSIKESIILTKPGTQNSFQFKFSGGELSKHSSIDGALAIKGIDENKIYISQLVIYEFGLGAISEKVSSQTTDGQNIYISVDSDWLKQQTADKYPIIIDPTFHRQDEIQYKMFKSDGYYCDGSVCYANTGSLNDGSWKSWRTYIYFPYSTLDNKHIINADIHGYFKSGIGGDTTSRSISMGHANCISGFNCVGTLVGTDSTVSTDFDIDFTTGLQSTIDVNDFGAWWSIKGVEGTVQSYKPYWDMAVDVTYNTIPPMTDAATAVPAEGTVITNTRPVLKIGAVTDVDGDAVQYYFRVGTNPNAENGTVINSGWLNSTQWTVPDNILQDGRTYYWHVHTYDGTDSKTPTWTKSFKVDLRRGKDSTQAYQEVGPIGIDLATGNGTTSTSSHSISALGGDIGLNLTYNSPVMPSPGLVGEYWNGSISGNPVMTRVDESAKFNWGSGSPDATISADNFSGRWTGYIVAPTSGTYTLGCYADDQCSLYINNTLVASKTTAGSVYASPMNLTAGVPVAYKLESHENTGNAKIYAWIKDSNGNDSHIDPSWFVTAPASISAQYGLTGRYYSDDGTHTIPSDPNKLLMVRNDEKVGFDWSTGSVASGIQTDNFIIRWNGYLTVPSGGSYILGGYGYSEDGMIIKVDVNRNGTYSSDETILNSPSGASGNRWGTAKTLTGNVRIPIQVDFFETTGSAKFRLLIDPFDGGGQEMPISWLSYDANILPDGWNLATGNGSARFEKMYVGSNTVVLTDSTSQTYEYKWSNSSYNPPSGEKAVVSRNSDGSFTVNDSDGSVYIFDNDGKLSSFTAPTDDRQPAALRYEYSGNPVKLTKIIDGVDSSRYGTLFYAGSSECATGDGLSPAPTGMLCAFKTTDGNKTLFQYSSAGNLARTITPGDAQEDYGYDSLRRITSYKSITANDAIKHYVRNDDATAKTEISYDPTGRTSSITAPAPTASGYRIQNTFEYLTSSELGIKGKTKMHTVGATEPNGFSKMVEYDDKLRTVKETNLANLANSIEWHSDKDIVLSTTDATGLKSTNIYTDRDILTDSYGPAPSAWFNSTTRLPLSGYTSQVPHIKTNYDEGMAGFDTSWYNLKSSNMTIFGAPIYNSFGFAGPGAPENGNPAYARFDYTVNPKPVNPDTSIPGVDGYAVRANGYLTFPGSGTYNFKVRSDDSIRVVIDGKQIANNWGTKTSGLTLNDYDGSITGVVAGKSYPIYIEYGHTGTEGAFAVYMSGQNVPNDPGVTYGTRDWSNYIKTGYDLATSTISYDSVLGNSKTTTEYSNPAYGTISQATIDPDGLALENKATYETPGTGFLRQTSRTTASDSVFTYNYYGATETKDNPCTLESDTVSQAGKAKGKTEPDPDGSGSQVGRTTETIYGSSGVVVATRYNDDAWTCVEYDTRGRVTSTVVPERGSLSARTITNSYNVDDNPLVTSTTDSSGTITTTSDLLGRIINYTDADGHTTDYVYDNYGKLTSKTSLVGVETYEYDQYDRLTVYKLDNVTFATIDYDQYSRINSVSYQSGISFGNVTRDSLGRETGLTYALADSTALTDEISRSVSGKITSGIENGTSKSYQYDSVGRLTSATIGDNNFTYSFDASDASCGGLTGNNVNAGKSGNRTSQTINGVATTYCYDYADKLIASSDPKYDQAIYDDHGNTISLGDSINKTEFAYDSSDRNIGISETTADGVNSVTYIRDNTDRIISRQSQQDGDTISNETYGFTGSGSSPDFVLDTNNNITQKFINLPGGVLVTIKPQSTSAGSTTYSLNNMHGDTMATVNADGTMTGTYISGPFGEHISGQEDPNNAANGVSYLHLGKHKKMTESTLVISPTQMGKRVYIPGLGRFMQVDSIEGGTSNNYVYALDPINEKDLNGKGFWDVFWGTVTVINFVVCEVPTATENLNYWLFGGGSDKTSDGSGVSFKVTAVDNVNDYKSKGNGTYDINGSGTLQTTSTKGSESIGGAKAKLSGKLVIHDSTWGFDGVAKDVKDDYDFDIRWGDWGSWTSGRNEANMMGQAIGATCNIATRGMCRPTDYSNSVTGEFNVIGSGTIE